MLANNNAAYQELVAKIRAKPTQKIVVTKAEAELAEAKKKSILITAITES